MSAPCSTRAQTTSSWPPTAAQWSGVRPTRNLRSSSLPAILGFDFALVCVVREEGKSDAFVTVFGCQMCADVYLLRYSQACN